MYFVTVCTSVTSTLATFWTSLRCTYTPLRLPMYQSTRCRHSWLGKGAGFVCRNCAVRLARSGLRARPQDAKAEGRGSR